jgi:hypothetical protein
VYSYFRTRQTNKTAISISIYEVNTPVKIAKGIISIALNHAQSQMAEKKQPLNKGLLILNNVESPRIELGSKQATKKLSTRLFPD